MGAFYFSPFRIRPIGKAIGATPGEYKEFLYEPNVLLYSNGSLHFKRITKEAQGHFLCEAKNNIGAGVSKVIFLKVNGMYAAFTISFFISFFISFHSIIWCNLCVCQSESEQRKTKSVWLRNEISDMSMSITGVVGWYQMYRMVQNISAEKKLFVHFPIDTRFV